MNAAKLERSNRLQRVCRLLKKGGEYSTRDIVQRAKVCAVNSIIAELRENGFDIRCVQRNRIWYYSLVE